MDDKPRRKLPKSVCVMPKLSPPPGRLGFVQPDQTVLPDAPPAHPITMGTSNKNRMLRNITPPVANLSKKRVLARKKCIGTDISGR